MVRAVLVTACLGSALLLGCAPDEVNARTQLMLVADTDIADLNQIAFNVREDARERTSGRIAVASGDAPFTMAVLREEGSLGPLVVSARGFRGETLLVERSAVVSFTPGKTLTVVLHLVQSCMTLQCESDETCTERGCQLPDAGTPAPWNGTAPILGEELDAGMPGADAGADAGQQSDAGQPSDAGDGSDANWMQCGSRTVDVNSDLDHCGRCSRPCRLTGDSASNVVAACTDGECGSACRPLWGDCDGDERNGCENSLALDSENCGACGMTCASEDYCWVGACRPRSN
jgi:hypothetical protein